MFPEGTSLMDRKQNCLLFVDPSIGRQSNVDIDLTPGPTERLLVLRHIQRAMQLPDICLRGLAFLWTTVWAFSIT